jgi:hypothetical protein
LVVNNDRGLSIASLAASIIVLSAQRRVTNWRRAG